MAFVNTVDLIGDETLAGKIIDRTITEIADSNATSIGGYAFYNCKNLTSADFLSITSITEYAFNSCTQLTVLILRSEIVCTLSSTAPLTGTPINSGTGCIYVPRSLVDSYKAATNWSSLANQIRAIEDYPEICGG